MAAARHRRFIYIAMGDYAASSEGEGRTVLRHRGGGIVRIRPDGTGSSSSSKARAHYDVAVSPTLDIFTRDNTTTAALERPSQLQPPGAQWLPDAFVNFVEDHPTLADYGGGSRAARSGR